MSFGFNGGSTTLELPAALLTSPPLTLICDFMVFDVANDYTLISLSQQGAASSTYLRLYAAGSAGGDPVRAQSVAGGSSPASSAGSIAANRWIHGGAVFAANNNRLAYMDGIAGTANTSNRTVAGINRTNIGAHYSSLGLSGVAAAKIANVALYQAALTPGEMHEIGARRRSPLDIRPDALVLFMPLSGETHLRDMRFNRSVFANAGAVPLSDSPPSWTRRRRFYRVNTLPASARALSGSLAEAEDAAAGVAEAGISGSLARAETSDSAAAAAGLWISGAAAIVDRADSAAGSLHTGAANPIAGAIAVTESNDRCVAHAGALSSGVVIPNHVYRAPPRLRRFAAPSRLRTVVAEKRA
jgi:hypothetical protein